MKKTLIAITLLTLLSVSAFSCSDMRLNTRQAPSLAVSKVVLYQNGVGYFERRGKISGDELNLNVRYDQINDFERMLSENGTVVLKLMLHISFDEQRARLQERIDDETKNWKFSMGDLDARKQWKPYQAAYDNLLTATSTPWAPWTVVPADSKTHRNLMVATLVRDRLQKLGLRYPPSNPALKGMKVV